MKVYCYEVAERMHSAGKEALLAFAEGDELKGMLMEMMFLLWKRYSLPTAYEVAIAELEEQHKARVRLAQMRREAREARQQNFSALGHLVDQELSQLN